MKKMQGAAGQTSKAHRTFRMVALAAAAALLLPLIGSAGVVPNAQAAPQAPADPTLVWSESFDDGTNTSGGPLTLPVPLNNYMSKDGHQYTANNAWLPSAGACNGWILNYSTAASGASSDGGCSGGGGRYGTGYTTSTPQMSAWWFLQQMALALGTYEQTLGDLPAGETPQTNNAISSQTNSGADQSAAQTILFSTPTVAQGIPGHYYQVSAYFAASHCQQNPSTGAAWSNAAVNTASNNWNDPQELLSLKVNDTVVPLTGKLNPCTAPGHAVIAGTVGSPAGTAGTPIAVVKFISQPLRLDTAQSLGMQLDNYQNLSGGNDVAFDMPQIVDVTPTLDKTFGTVDAPITGNIAVGEPVPMTFTITNTTEKGQKDDWQFTDTLPDHMSVIPDSPSTPWTNDCVDPSPLTVNPAVTGSPTYLGTPTTNYDPATNALSVTGSLAAGMSYCTITVYVEATYDIEYTNGGENLSDDIGLILPPPNEAKITIDPPTLSIDKTITKVEYPAGTADGGATIAGDNKSASALKAGDIVTYSYQVTNTSAVRLDDVWALEADQPGTTPIDYPFNGKLPDGTTSTGSATAEELGASFNGSDTTPVIGSCTYDQDGAYGSKGSSVDNGAIRLDPDESATCTATYLVTQTDVDAYAQGASGPTPAGVVNTSVAIGTNYYTENDTPSRQSASDTSTATITFDTTATFDVTKTPATQTMTAPGTVDWTVTATNSGKVTLSSVTVTDATMSNGSAVSLHDCYLNGDENATFANDGTESLSPGDVVTCTATYEVTQDDIAAGTTLTNTATASGKDPAGGDVTHDATATIEVATLHLQKTADKTDLTVGEFVTYTFELTNTGSVPITGATINDSTFNGDGTLGALDCPTWPSGTVGTINPNETVTCTATYTVTQKDVDDYYASGKTVPLTNSATATGKDPSDDTVTSNTSTVELPSPSNAHISLTKTPDKTTVTGAEQTVTYTIKATNDGTVTLTNVTVSDDGVTTPTTTTPEAVTVSPDCTVTSAAGVESPATNGAITLAPNEYATCTATYTTSQADIDSGGPLTNHAAVTGDDPTGDPTTSDITSDVNVTQTPSLTITKSADDAAMTASDVAGDTITYTFDVHNTGNVTITDISVDDSTQFTGADPTKLSAVTCTPTTLTPDQHASCEATYVVQQADVDKFGDNIVNTATVTGKDPTDTDTTADSNQVTVLFAHHPKLTIVKTADPTTVTAADQTVSYSFLITNEGNVTMTDVAVNETDFTGHGSPLSVLCPDDWSQDSSGTPVVGMLLPHASITCAATYTVTQEDIDAGSIDNTATASGYGPDRDKEFSEPSEATVDVTQDSSLTITKSADSAAMTGNDVAGDTITYTFDVHNTGNVTISHISVDDSTHFTGADPTKLSAVTCDPTTLTPDQHASCEATYVVQQADVDRGSIDNTATVTGKDPTDTDTTADSNQVTVDFTPNPELSLTKLVSPSDKAHFTVGQQLTYSFVVTNTGNVTITDLAINDAGTAPTDTTPGFTGAGALSAIDCGGVTTLVPQGTEAETGGVSSVTCTASYTIEQDDVDAGKIDNTAVATGKDPTDTDVTSNPSSAEMPGEPNPVVTLTKDHLAAPNPAAAGDTVTFTFVVKNMGNVTLDGSTLTIADTMTDISAVTCPASGSDWPNPDETLKPGESVTCSATYTLKQSDIDAGQIVNPQAVATITPVNSTTPVDSEPADDTVPLTSTSDLTLSKSSTSTPTHMGDTIDYTLVVTNNGATTISGLSVADTDFTGTGTAPVITCSQDAADWTSGEVGVLKPNDTITCTATYTVTQDDVDAGVVSNTAQAHGTDINGPVDSNPSTKDVTITPTPSLTLDKTATPTSVTAAGQTITYSFVVTNDGNVSLSDLTIDETQFTGADGLTALSTPTCTPVALHGTLAPDATTTCTAKYVVTQADIDAGGSIDNTATASGTAPGTTDPTTSHESSATVEVTQDPKLTLAKSVTPSDKLILDEELTYSFLVTNTGNVTITNLAIDDGDAYVDASTPGFSGTGTLSAIDCGGVTTLVPQGDPASPAAGSSVTCTATYTVTQDDVNAGNVKNTATATGKDPSDTAITSDPDQAMVPADQVPEVSLTKSHIDPSGPVKAGDTVTFLFTVNNSGNVSLDGDTFSFYDSLPTMRDVVCPADGQDWPNTGNHTLNPTQSVTCSATYELTQTDVDRGYVENQQATVTATPVGSTTPVTSDPANDTVPLTSTPHLTLVKDSTSTPVNVGDTIDYTFTVTNDGDLTINDLVIAETAFSGTNGAPTATCDATTLAPTEHTTCTATYTVTQDDINAGFVNNTATATGTPEGADPTPVTSDESSKTIDFPSQPSLKLTKSATPTTDLTLGDTVTYSFLVENTGNVTVHGIQINETDFSGTGTLTGLNCPVTSLDSGATTTCTASYKITQTDVDTGKVNNTATATGFSPSNAGTTPDVTSDPSSASVTTAQNPSISLTKTPDPVFTIPHVGDVVMYRFTVVNTGDVTLNHVTVDDPGPTNGTGTMSDVVCVDTLLVPQGAETATLVSSTVCAASYTLTQHDIDAGVLDNSATVTGTPPKGDDVTDDSSARVTLTADPKLSVTKDADRPSISAPGDITYTITVTNTGNVTLDPLVVTDPGPVGGHGDMAAVACDDTKLVPQGAETETGGVSSTTCTATYSANQADIDAGDTLTNTVTATGTAPDASTTSGQASADVAVRSNPAISLTKAADPTTVAAPGQVTYTFTVSNDGNTTLNDIGITDPGPAGGDGTMTLLGCLATSLEPYTSTTCTATYLVTQVDIDAGADLVNTATASGTPAGSTTAMTSDPAEATVTIDQQPSLDIVKSADPSDAMPLAGQTITYTFVVTNNGNVTVTDIAIDDTAFSGSGTLPTPTCDVTTLAPTEQTTCTTTYTVTQTDFDAGELTNEAVATGTDTDNQPVTSGPSDARVPADQTTSVDLVKSHDTPATPAAMGDIVTFHFAVTNTGNVTLDVATLHIADTMTGLSTVTCPTSGTLVHGQTVNCTATYTLTQADVDNRSIYNPSAIAMIDDVNGKTATSDPVDDTVPLTGSSALTLDKTVTPDTASAVGDVVAYGFKVTNTGTYTLKNLVIDETAFSGTGTLGTPACPVTELAPHASTTCTVSYTLTQEDVNAGTVTNTAIAKADAPNGSTTQSSPSSATVTIAATPSITIAKTADVTTVTNADDPINYTFTVTNTGNVTLDPVSVSDPMLTAAGLAITCDATSLAPKASTDCAASGPYLVSQAQIDANAPLTNTATASGTPPTGTTVTNTDTATVTPTVTAKLTLVKSADQSSNLALGAKVNYSFIVTNIGNVTIDHIAIDDSTFDGSPAVSVTCPDTTLLPGASTRCTASPYTVTQADIDRGHLSNTATANGTDPQSQPVASNDSSWDIPQPAIGELTVTKAATESSVATAGTVVHYTLTATNTTNVTLTHVIVTDGGVTNNATPATTTPVTVAGCYLNGDNAATLDNSAGFQLEPGDVATCTATYTATQADIDAGGQLTNPATASGKRPDNSTIDSNTATVEVPIQPTTGLHVTKDPSAQTVTAVGPVTWTITATNTGSATLNGVKIDDATMSNGGAVTVANCTVDGTSVDNGTGFDLAPGKSAQCTATYTVTTTDMAGGQRLTNTASASGTAVGGTMPVTSNNATATVDIAALTIAKTTDTARVTAADQVISYTITATNGGTVTLTGVTVTDAGVSNLANTNVSGPLSVTCPAASGWASGVVGTLAPGDSVDCTASYKATQADVDAGGTLTNQATASSHDPDGTTVDAGQATVTVPVQPAPGKLTLTKKADQSDHLTPGATVNYSFVVTNSGGLTIDNIAIDDSTFSGSGGVPSITCPVTTLAPGESTTCTAVAYTVTQDDVNAGTLDNTAKATGTDSHSDPVTSNDSSWSIPQPADDKLVVTKDASRTSVEAANDQVNYTITAINQGNVTLTGVVVTDAGVTNGAGTTTPVTVGGCYLNGVNTATLNNVTGFTLNPGDVATCTASYTATQADIDAGKTLDNQASASGVDPSHTPVDSNQAPASVDVTPNNNLTVAKTPASQTVTAAGDVTWTITATNHGTAALTGVKIVDPSMSNGSAVTLSGCAIGATPVDNDLGFTLPAGAAATCTATYTVTSGDIAAAAQLSNTANASGTDPNGTAVNAMPSTAKVDIAGLHAVKTPATTTVSATGDVTWTVTATNTGSVTLNGVKVADPQMSNGGAVTLSDCQIGTMSVNNNAGFALAPQESVTCQATYTVTQADLNAGTTLTNTANATGTASNGVTVQSNDATATVAITQSPALTLLKTADDTNTLAPGQKVHYSFLVTNTGNVTVSNITIDDSVFSGSPAIGGVTCPTTTLLPNASTTCTADNAYTVTQDDVNSGILSNTATANGTAPDGTTPVTSNTSDWNIPQTPNASVGIVETPSKASGLMVGDKLTFDVTATNNGNVTLTNVTVANLAAGWTGSGPMPDIDLTTLKVNGVPVTNGTFTLNPGDQVTYTTLPYTVLQADVDNNTPLANEASVVGTPPVATGVRQVSADTTVPATLIAANAHIGIVETPSQPSGLKAGDKLTFNIVATNNGNVTLHNVYLNNDPTGWTGSGPMPGLAKCTVDGVPVVNGQFSLAPGQSVVCVTTPYTVSTADVGSAKAIANRAVVTGAPPTGLHLVAVSASTVVPATTVAPVVTPTPISAPAGPVVQTGGTMDQSSPAWVLLILLAAIGALVGSAELRRRSQSL